MTEQDELPEKWVLGQVDMLGEFINGVAFKPTDWGSTGTPIIRIQNLTDPDKPLNFTERTVEERYVVERGDILVSWSATLDVFKWRGPHAFVNQHIFKVVPNPAFDKEYVFYALKEAIQELVNSEHLHGTTMKHINRKPFLAHPIPIAPIDEQHRIVEKIETLFAQLDKGEEGLREVRKLLARYRQSVLKAAVTGQLTADWRAENAHRLEHGRDLLERILEQRRETWEGRGKYKEPAEPEDDHSPVLPSSWAWATLDQLVSGQARSMQSGPFGSNLKHSEFQEEGVLVVGIDNVRDGYFSMGSENRISLRKYKELEKYTARPGDLLVTVMASLGRTCVVPDELETAIITKHVYRISIERELLEPAFYNFLLQAEWASRRHMFENAQGQTRPGLNSSILRTLPVPLPSLSEQQEIVVRLQEELSEVDQAEKNFASELARSAALRQSILKEAFAGRLVPQDPADEPATDLLARIKETRATAPKKSRQRAAGVE